MHDAMPVLKLYSVAKGQSSLKKSKPARHKHLLLYKTQGTTYYFIGEKRYCVSEGDVIFIPDGTSYSVETAVPGGYISVVFLCDFFDNTPQHKRIPGIGEYFENLFHSFNYGNVEILHGYSLLYEILYRITLHRKNENSAPHNLLMCSNAAEYMNKNYTSQSFKILDIYKLAGVSSVYLCKVFKTVYGVTPSKYLARLRLSKAKELLCEGKSVADTAYSIGFSDPMYFSKFFRKQTGLSPSEYEERYRE